MNLRGWRIIFIGGCGLWLSASGIAGAIPDITERTEAADLTLLRDRDQVDLYYALPTGVTLQALPDGGPDLTFSVARYSGSRVREDSGRIDILSILRIGIHLDEPDASHLQAAEADLSARMGRDITVTRLLPSSVKARLIYADAGTPADLEAKRAYDEASATGQTVWRERDIVLGFSPETGEMLHTILAEGLPGLSLAWEVRAEAWGPEAIDGTITQIGSGSDAAINAEDLATTLDAALEETVDPQAPQIFPVLGDAIALRLAEEERPSRLTIYDIDAALPPSYPSLAAYCFTFDNHLRPDLYERVLQIEATGVMGETTGTEVAFSALRPRDYAETIRFRYAVDLKQPYRWRVRDTLMTGEERLSDWTQSERWTAIIDITNALSPPEPSVDAVPETTALTPIEEVPS